MIQFLVRGSPVSGETIFGRVEALRDNPDMGRIVPEFEQSFLRELIHPPFRIVYRRDRDRVRIIQNIALLLRGFNCGFPSECAATIAGTL